MEGLEYYDEESMNDAMNEALNYENEVYDYENDNKQKYIANEKIQYYLNNSELTKYEVGINEMYRESKPEFNKLVILEYTKIIHSTESAWKLGRIDNINGETEFWIPKSVYKLNEEDNLIAIPI